MRLYHGTNFSSAQNIIVNGIDLKYSKPYLDFGAGFYTTPSYDHAAVTAIRAARKYNARYRKNDEPYIVTLNFTNKKELSLKIVQYPRHSEKWGRFVLNNRLTNDILQLYDIKEHNQDSKYDICFGEIADGNIVNIAYEVNQGNILPSDVDFHKFLKSNGKNFPMQYSFHTFQALSCITVLSCGTITNKEKYLKRIEGR